MIDIINNFRKDDGRDLSSNENTHKTIRKVQPETRTNVPKFSQTKSGLFAYNSLYSRKGYSTTAVAEPGRGGIYGKKGHFIETLETSKRPIF